MTTIEITIEEYERLQEAESFLNCLEAAGVDNWIGYADACDMFHEDEEEED